MPEYKNNKLRIWGFKLTHTATRDLRVGLSSTLLLLACVYCLMAYQFAVGITLSKYMRLALIVGGAWIFSFFMLEVVPLSSLSEMTTRSLENWTN